MEVFTEINFFDSDNDNKHIHSRHDILFFDYKTPHNGWHVFGDIDANSEPYTLLEIEKNERYYSGYGVHIYNVLVKKYDQTI
jgi:hypothetical protein